MHNPFLFFRDLARQPLWVSIWVALLAAANLASIFFWPDPLAKTIFVTFMVSAAAMMVLYSYFGFEKILGAGHVLWIFLLPYILLELPRVDEHFSLYLSALSVLIAISLVFDIVDVWKYLSGWRA